MNKMFVVLVLVFSMFVMFGCTSQFAEPVDKSPVTNNTAPVTKSVGATAENIIEFYGEECPHCKNMVSTVNQVEQEMGISFEKLEVWHNNANQQVMLAYANDLKRDCGGLGVPAFYSTKTKKAVCGEMSADALKAFVLSNG